MLLAGALWLWPALARRAGGALVSVLSTRTAAGPAAGRLPRALVVTLPAAVGGPGGRGCLDGPWGPQAAAFYTQGPCPASCPPVG